MPFFRDMHRVRCEGKPGLCEKMNPVDGTDLLDYLKKVQFHGKILKLQTFFFQKEV